MAFVGTRSMFEGCGFEAAVGQTERRRRRAAARAVVRRTSPGPVRDLPGAAPRLVATVHHGAGPAASGARRRWSCRVQTRPTVPWTRAPRGRGDGARRSHRCPAAGPPDGPSWSVLNPHAVISSSTRSNASSPPSAPPRPAWPTRSPSTATPRPRRRRILGRRGAGPTRTPAPARDRPGPTRVPHEGRRKLRLARALLTDLPETLAALERGDLSRTPRRDHRHRDHRPHPDSTPRGRHILCPPGPASAMPGCVTSYAARPAPR